MTSLAPTRIVVVGLVVAASLFSTPLAFAQQGYVLDAYGGVYTGGGASPLLPATPYFGFPIARDLELTYGSVCGKGCIYFVVGYYVLDGFGGVHNGGAALPVVPGSKYFGFDVAVDLELVSSLCGTAGNPPCAYRVLDNRGGIHVAGGTGPQVQVTPYFGFDIARDLEGYYLHVLDGYGGVHAPATPPTQPTPYFGFDIARDLELAGNSGFYVLDGYGGVHAGDGVPGLSPATPYFGFDIAEDFEWAWPGFYVLDGFGGIHAGGGVQPMNPATPYFGFDAARDLEIVW